MDKAVNVSGGRSLAGDEKLRSDRAVMAALAALGQIVYQKGPMIGIRWVPGHCGAEGNK